MFCLCASAFVRLFGSLLVCSFGWLVVCLVVGVFVYVFVRFGARLCV